MARVDTIKFWVTFVFRLLLIFAIGQSIYFGDWTVLFYSVITLILISLPSIIEKSSKIDYPSEFEILIMGFIFASLYLGEINSFYTRFWWWDGMLHTFSGLIIALIGFTLVLILNNEEKVRMKLGPGFVAIFAFCFALAAGVIWEMFEFWLDSFFGMSMQETGIVDTMWDLIVDSIGALIVSAIGYFYLRGGFTGLKKLEQNFIELNRDWFK